MPLIIVMAVCVIIQVVAGVREMFQWDDFSEGVIGLTSLLENVQDEGVRSAIFDATSLLGLNQGFYNLCLAFGIAAAMFLGPKGNGRTLALYTLGFMFIVGVFGAATVLNPESGGMQPIFAAQAIPPLIALVLLMRKRA